MNGHLDDTEGYALGLLSGREAAAAEEHLASCRVCRRRAAEQEAAAHLLLRLPPPVEPRACLEEKVVAAFRGAVQQERLGASAAGRRLAERPRQRWPRLLAPAPALAFALVAITVALLAWGLMLNQRADERAEDVQARDALLRTVLSGESVVRLQPTTPGRDAILALVVSSTGTPTLVVQSAAMPPAGRVYQVWLLKEQQPVSAGIFRPAGDVTTFPITPHPAGFDQIAVTEEPPGGSPLPTGEILYAARLPLP